jgi:hypothetical protein
MPSPNSPSSRLISHESEDEHLQENTMLLNVIIIIFITPLHKLIW